MRTTENKQNRFPVQNVCGSKLSHASYQYLFLEAIAFGIIYVRPMNPTDI